MKPRSFLAASFVSCALLTACGDTTSTAPKPVQPPIAQQATPFPKPVLNVPELAAQPPGVVAQQLGEPLNCEASKYGKSCTYRDKTEVVFINDRADWITVNADLPYSAEAMPLLGFKPARPSFDNEYSMRWSGEQGTLLIQLTPGAGGRAAFAYVKVLTR